LNTKFNWGIIGTGGIANAFAKDLSYLKDHGLAAVGSRTIINAQNFASKFLYLGSNNLLIFCKVKAITVASIFTWLKKDEIVL